MKTSLANAKTDSVSVETARGFVGANVALPGFGSIMAKRAVGWPQAALTLVGFLLTGIFGFRAITWFAKNMSHIYAADSDPVQTLLDMWREMRFALLGIALFAISWIWSAITNASILREAKRKFERAKPPVLR